MKVQAYGGPHDGATMSVRRGTTDLVFPLPAAPLQITGWTITEAWDEAEPTSVSLPVVVQNGRHYVINPPYWPNDAVMEDWLEDFYDD